MSTVDTSSFSLSRGNFDQLEMKLYSGETPSPLEKLMVYQACSRKWRRELTMPEFLALSYIVDRTIGWGNKSFLASSANVVHGTDSYAGVGTSSRSYFSSLNSLEGKGAIHRKSFRDRTRIHLNVNWWNNWTV